MENSYSPLTKSGDRVPGRGAWIGALFLSLLIFGIFYLYVETGLFFEPVDQAALGWFKALEDSLSANVHFTVRVISAIAGNGLAFVSVLLAIWWGMRGEKRKLALIMTSVWGGELLWLALMFAIGRPRPETVVSAVGVALPGFPSGHALIVMTFWGMALYIFWPRLSAVGRTLAAALAVFWIFGGGFVRLLLGAHYLTDVLAGYAIGAAWFCAAVLLVEWLFQRRRAAVGAGG